MNLNFRKTMPVAVFLSLPLLLLSLTAASGGHSALPAAPTPSDDNRHCVPVGGSISTNLGVIDPFTTLGTATGDLRGALAAKILGVSQKANNVVFTVQHHWVTEAGETLIIDQTNATSTPVAPGLLAITDYTLPILDGTGKFAGATGKLHLIGEVHCEDTACSAGQTVFRYTGQVCFAEPD
jgi:hypothetical protein